MAYPRGYAVELGLVYSSQSIDIPMLLHPQSYGHLDHQYWRFYKMATMVLTTKMIPDTGGTELPPVEKHMSRFSFPSRLCMSLPLPALPLAGSFSPFIVCLNAFAFGSPLWSPHPPVDLCFPPWHVSSVTFITICPYSIP